MLEKDKNDNLVNHIKNYEEKEYYINLFNYIGSLGIKVNCKFMETKESKDYLEKLSLLKNMKFDYIVGNPPFGSVGGDTLHLKCLDKVYDLFTKKMLMIMPLGFVTKDTRSNKKYQIKFAPKLQYVKEVAGNNFEGTSMFSAAIYEFNNNISKTTIIEDINGNTIEKDDLTNISKFNEYEKEIIKYLESKGKQEGTWAGGHSHCTKRSLEKQGITNPSKVQELINKNILDNSKQLKDNKVYLMINAANGGMNGTAISPKMGNIFDNLTDLKNEFIKRNQSTGYNVLIFNTKKEAENCKIALKNPLLRFTIYRMQNDQNMGFNRAYKYIPNIDWEDDRVKTDEGLLEVCGCPKDKCKEYAEYCKKIIDEVDKK